MGIQRAGKLEPSEEGQVRLAVGGSPPASPCAAVPLILLTPAYSPSIQSEHLYVESGILQMAGSRVRMSRIRT